jgi:hypothetical protein
MFSYLGKPARQLNTKARYAALKRAGITDFRWHDLRQPWASWHVQLDTPLHALQVLGGWESAEMGGSLRTLLGGGSDAVCGSIMRVGTVSAAQGANLAPHRASSARRRGRSCRETSATLGGFPDTSSTVPFVASERLLFVREYSVAVVFKLKYPARPGERRMIRREIRSMALRSIRRGRVRLLLVMNLPELLSRCSRSARHRVT